MKDHKGKRMKAPHTEKSVLERYYEVADYLGIPRPEAVALYADAVIPMLNKEYKLGWDCRGVYEGFKDQQSSDGAT